MKVKDLVRCVSRGMGREGLTRTLVAIIASLYFGSVLLTHMKSSPINTRDRARVGTGQIVRRTLDHLKVEGFVPEHDVLPDGEEVISLADFDNYDRKGPGVHQRLPDVNKTGPPDTSSLPILVPSSRLVLHQPYICHQIDNDDVTLSLRYMPVHLLIIVHSHPSHKRRRNAIRETWGKVTREDNKDGQTVIVFLLGIPSDYEEYISVKAEAKLYRDVVVYDFVDSYMNLTTKALLGLYWKTKYCEGAKYVAKADDDVYLNVPKLTKVLMTLNSTDLIIGSLNLRSPVKRNGQWKVEVKDYPHEVFPPYCSGCAYVMSGDLPGKLYLASQRVEAPTSIPVEDVYVTGLLAERLSLRCTHHEGFPTWVTVPSLQYILKYLRSEIIGLHGVDWIRMHSLWQMIHRCANCSVDVREARRWFTWFIDQDPMYR